MLSVLDCKIIVRPNNSLSTEGMIKVFAIMASVALIVTLNFMRLGAWMVLPFAGLELLAFAAAFYYIKLHSDDYECITIDEENVIVEQRTRQGSKTSIFKRYWTQVSFKTSQSGAGQLCISSHGNEIEFGRGFIDDQQRMQLIQEIKQKLKYTN
jgi:uncharacterized membrane protein